MYSGNNFYDFSIESTDQVPPYFNNKLNNCVTPIEGAPKAHYPVTPSFVTPLHVLALV